jgi:hypothetical protein
VIEENAAIIISLTQINQLNQSLQLINVQFPFYFVFYDSLLISITIIHKQSIDILPNEFILEVQSTNSFTYTSNNGSFANKLKLEYTVVEEDTNLIFAGTSLFLPKDSLKLKVFISDWTFLPSSHYLQVFLSFIILFILQNE